MIYRNAERGFVLMEEKQGKVCPYEVYTLSISSNRKIINSMIDR